MDLREFENFQAMELTYLDVQVQTMNMNVHNPTSQQRAIADEMGYDVPQYILAHNWHHHPSEYRPELIPPRIQRHSATPPTQPHDLTGVAGIAGMQSESHLTLPSEESWQTTARRTP